MAWQGNGLGVSGGTGGGGMPGGAKGGGDFWQKMMQGQGGKGGAQGNSFGNSLLKPIQGMAEKDNERRAARATNWQQGEQGMAAGQAAGQAAAGAGRPPQQYTGVPQFGALPSMVPTQPHPSIGTQMGAGLGGAATVAPATTMGPGFGLPGTQGNPLDRLRQNTGMGQSQRGAVGQTMGGVGGMMSDERTKNSEVTSLRKRYAALGGR